MSEQIQAPEGIDVHTEPDDDGDDDGIFVSVHISHPGGTAHNASGHIDSTATDDELAALIINAATGAAVMQGSGVWMALQRRLNMETEGT